ncbi:MAG TPA: hypothetical protein VFI47_29495 [Acidimicrobiales bacterium]|nr:hypothetical protein [Acidimicrobiales bacterium]
MTTAGPRAGATDAPAPGPAAGPDAPEASAPDAAGTGTAGTAAPGAAAGRPWWRRPGIVGAAALAVLAVPLVVALGVLRQPRWYPLLDLAQAEMRVRDVGTAHPPLVGAAGRIEAFGHRGSHPGPVAYWALRPVYTLLGDTAFGLQVATATVNLVALGLALWIARRRGGVRLVLAVAALAVVVCRLYGADQLTEAWNPYMALLWWPVFLLAAWSVLCDDLALLPVAVFAGSWCLQGHNSYLGLVGGVGAGLAAVLAVTAWRRRRDRAALRRLAGWTALALGVGVVVWLPPVVEQLTREPGNISIVVEHLRHPAEEPIGARRGLELLGVHLDVWRLVRNQPGTSGSAVPAVLLLAAWLSSVVVAWRTRAAAALLRLDAVLGLVLVLSAVSVSRIFGEVWFYLALWAWGTTALMVLAIAWTAGHALARWRPDLGATARRVAPAAGAAVLVAGAAAFTWDAAHTDVPVAEQSRIVAAVAPATLDLLAGPDAPGGGADGRYLVTWSDPVGQGAAGQGLLLELERHGFDARGPLVDEVALRPHRVTAPGDTTAEVHMAVGADIARWREDRPDAREVAYVDGRSAAERARYAALRADLVAALDAAGRGDAAVDVDDRLVALAFDPTATPEIKDLVNAMATLGQPAAVFVTEQVTGT